MPSIKGTETEKNLLKAFAGESQARNRYTYYAGDVGTTSENLKAAAGGEHEERTAEDSRTCLINCIPKASPTVCFFTMLIRS